MFIVSITSADEIKFKNWIKFLLSLKKHIIRRNIFPLS